MNTLKITGGARIGQANVTWPFATLYVDNEKLELRAGILGGIKLKRDEIVSIVPYSGMVSEGIKINHRIKKYKENIIFWSGSPASLIFKIREIGLIK